MGSNIHSIIKFKESQVHCISGHFKEIPLLKIPVLKIPGFKDSPF